MTQDRRPTLPDHARLETAAGGLQRLVIATADAEAHVYGHGAHLTHFRPAGERPVLWMSQRSRFRGGTPGEPIRGGVPICFPWFGPGGTSGAPPHGFARLLPWALAEVAEEPEGIRATYRLEDSDYTRALWPGAFELFFSATVGPRLTMELAVHNRGEVDLTFEEALHTYLAVSDVRQISVQGLEGRPYLDKVGGVTPRPGAAQPISVAAETDRVYGGSKGTVTVADPGWARRIVVRKQGSATTVVWNPWAAKARAMPDFGDDEWPAMVCVETANAVDDAVTVPAGKSHVMSATIEVLPA